MTADRYVIILTFLSLPPALLYPLIYGLTSPWWRSWIGRALFIKAAGLAILLMFSCLFYMFGPDYWGREHIRVTGMTILTPGIWLAFFAMLQIKFGIFTRNEKKRQAAQDDIEELT